MSKGPGESHFGRRGAERHVRLAAALRENLHRRKAQAQGQAQARTAASDITDNNAAAAGAPASPGRATKGKTD